MFSKNSFLLVVILLATSNVKCQSLSSGLNQIWPDSSQSYILNSIGQYRNVSNYRGDSFIQFHLEKDQVVITVMQKALVVDDCNPFNALFKGKVIQNETFSDVKYPNDIIQRVRVKGENLTIDWPCEILYLEEMSGKKRIQIEYERDLTIYHFTESVNRNEWEF